MSYHFYAWHDLLGYLGVVFVLYIYFLTHTGKISFNSYPYALFNLAGSVLLLISLSYDPNPPSIVIEVAWFLISLYGLCRLYFL